MPADSGLSEAMRAARDRPDDPDAKAEVARAWLRVGKPKVAVAWAQDAYRMKSTAENAALLRAVTEQLQGPSSAGQQAPEQQPLRVEKWEVMATSLMPPPSPVPLESQLNAMFGGGLFREPTLIEKISVVHELRPPRRAASTFVRLVLATVAVGLVAFALAAQRVKHSRECAQLIGDLAGYLRTGELRVADEALERARVLAAEPDRARLLAPLMARAEATLYRYVDASDERRTSVEAMLAASGEGSFDAVIARALITPDAELAALQPVLQMIADETRDPEAAFLLAVSLVAAGRTEDADRAYARAVDLEPSHLPHLAHYAVWVTRSGRAEEAGEIVDQMKTIDPESPWIGWVEDNTR
jgi:tetratricopeptide (TPR) repeat protein